MQVNQLVLEVGRKCNMQCEHCLRGEAQNCQMNFEQAKFLIDQFESIGCITFTGGEPTLYPEIICQIIDYIIDNKKDVYSFYIASNGLIVNMELMFHLAKFYGYITELTGEAEFSAYDISTDHFHDKPNDPLYILKGFSFVTFRGDINDNYLINEGRAYDNQIGCRNLDHNKSFDLEDDYETVEMVYLNAKGYLLPDCDYSYATQDSMNPFNISSVISGKMTLKNIFEQYNN